MLIEVTQEDIRRGVPRHGSECPIASAIKRCLANDDVAVSDSKIEIGYPQYRWLDMNDVPDEVWAFVQNFDEGRSVSPFTFELPIAAGRDARVVRKMITDCLYQ